MMIITTQCTGGKYTPILPHWIARIKDKCPKAEVIIIEHLLLQLDKSKYAWWDVNRLVFIVELLKENNEPVVHCDIDVIVEKDLTPLVSLPYDFIISTEVTGWPQELTSRLGFGLCSGFYIVKPGAIPFLETLLSKMTTSESYSDQVNLMRYILDQDYTVTQSEYGKVISAPGMPQILGLDIKHVTRDPVFQREQYANHINIDNVGGTQMFIKFFYNPMESLPLTCRCGKTYLGDRSICPHIDMRKNKLNNSDNN